MTTHSLRAQHAPREQEVSFHALFLNYPDGVVVVGDDDTVVAVNPAAIELTGRSEEELQRMGGGGLLALLKPLDPGAAPVLANGLYTLSHADGGRLPVELRLVRWNDPAGVPLRSIHLARAARPEAAPAVEPVPPGSSARNAQLLAEVTARLVTSTDYPGNIQDILQLLVPALADHAVVDLREEEGVRRVAYLSAIPDGAALVPELTSSGECPEVSSGHFLAPVLNDGQPLLLRDISDEQMQSAAASPEQLALMRRVRPLSFLSLPLEARGVRHGAITFARLLGRAAFSEDELALARELARRVALNIDSARRYRGAERASRAKTEFLATMSHEIRIPLTAVIGYADLLESELMGPLLQEQRDAVQRIRAGAWHLVSLIEQVLSLSKIEAGRYLLQSERCDVRTIAREAEDLIRPTLRPDRLTLHVHLPEEPVELETDPNKLRQVLLNLLSNAVKFTPSGSVELGLRQDREGVAIWVSDSGIGIAAEHLQKIFDPFWQAEPFSPKRNGSGLGLAITHRLVTLLGGTIAIDSQVGMGSRFTIYFPGR